MESTRFGAAVEAVERDTASRALDAELHTLSPPCAEVLRHARDVVVQVLLDGAASICIQLDHDGTIYVGIDTAREIADALDQRGVASRVAIRLRDYARDDDLVPITVITSRDVAVCAVRIRHVLISDGGAA